MRLTVRATSGIAVAAVAGLVAVGAAVPASAETPATGAQPAHTTHVATSDEADSDAERRQQRLAVACARIPNLVTRTENLQERLAGDADRRGSLVWLEEQVARAEERGRDQLATALSNRLEVRRELADLLPLRLDALAEAREYCDEADL